MNLRSRRARVSVVLGLALLAAFAWLRWLRPIDAGSGPVPSQQDDGWRLCRPATQGFDEAALLAATQRLVDRPLDVHAVVIERHRCLVAEMYRGGLDRSVYSLVSTRQSFGPATLHDVRSVGKSVTGLLYGIALAEGRVPATDQPVALAFPGLAGRAAKNARVIGIRDLLDMGSGLAWTEGRPGLNDELKLFWKRDLPAYVLDHPMSYPPGTVFNYNGGGTALLAAIIADGTGEPLDQFAQARLFEPMGIRSWEWVRDVHGRPMAFNGLRLRPRDLLKLGRLVLDDGRWDGRQLVPADWVRDARAPGLPTNIDGVRYRGQWWTGTARWKGRAVAWQAAFGNGGQRLFVVHDLDLAIATTAGAYDQLPTAIAVNRFVQDVVDTVER